MNKATIVTDAITYILEQQKCVEDLSDQLIEMDETMPKEPKTEYFQVDAAEEMKNWGIEPEVKVTCIDGNRLWIKIVFEKKRGGFTKLIEAMSVLGIDFVDINVTTFKGAILVTSSIEGMHGGIIAADEVMEFLLEIMKCI